MTSFPCSISLSHRCDPKKPAPPVTSPGDFEWQSTQSRGGSFEDMMSKFKQTSEDKMAGLKQHGADCRGGNRRGNGSGRR